MSRRDYIAIARVMRTTIMLTRTVSTDADAELEEVEHLAIEHDRNRLSLALADLFGDDNPNFDRARFLSACGCHDFPNRRT